MKFVCEKSVLLREIAIAQEIVSSKQVMSVLSNIYLEAVNGTLVIKSTDLKVNFSTKVPVSVAKEGSVTVLGDKFLGILAKLPDGEFEFSVEETNVIVKSLVEKVKNTLKSNSTEQFPPFPDMKKEKFFDIPVKDFKDMISQTIFAVSDDQTRYFMNGIFLEKAEGKLIMVSTDGRRLAFINKEIGSIVDDFEGVIIPVKVLGVIFKHAGDEGVISIAVSDNEVFFNFGAYSFSSQLIEGQFPNYRRVIPENQQFSFIVNRHKMLKALERVGVLIEQKTRRIYLDVKEGGLTVSSDESEVGNTETEIDCMYSGADARISLNHQYLEEPFKNMNSDDVGIYFTETSKAITIKPVPESDFFHIVMPMQEA